MIEGGFYLKARRIQESSIMHAPPHVREIWDWLLMKAMFADGVSLQRGQVLASYEDMRNALSWNVGYRKERYSKSDCENAMKWLTKEQMITKMKTTRGIVITICKYSFYQNPKNYENHTESHNKATREPQSPPNIDKNIKKKEVFIVPTLEQVTSYCKERKNFVDPQRFVDYYEANGWKVGRNPMRSWQAAVRTWEKNATPKQTPQSEFL